MNQIDILEAFTEWQNPILTFFATIFTFLGNEEFYFIILPFVYWCISKPIGFRLFYVFLVSIFINAFLKIQFAVQRPIGIEGINSLFVSSAEVGSHYPYDSFPSGHAQGSMTLWGYLALIIRNKWFSLFAVFLILSISLSRLYAGVHWPTDVITGIGIGLAVILAGFFLQEKIASLPAGVHWGLVIAFPFLLTAIFPHSEGLKYAGFLLGAGIGYLLEKQHVQMKIPQNWLKKSIAFGVGFVGIIALQSGVKIIFPETATYDFIRYGLIGLWGLLGAPYVFVKLGLYPTGGHSTQNKKTLSA
ncbi:phosphatase PAP2 family protein [Bacillus sp. FJAT-44742]|uniref:phosphatase PAP2 family protein n=1 Tax=Bacillus sp. FJAT-44742 TaxID=2014005 RepID=UPI000C243EA6|nr:phosphatase PAP2 family protein [Bacillus sp. FJAT-44742]